MAILMLQGMVSKGMHSTVCDPGFLKKWLPQIVTDIGMQSVGKPIVEQSRDGDWFLVKGHVKKGFRKIYVDNIRKLSDS